MDTVAQLLRTLASRGVKLSVEAGRLHCYAKQPIAGDVEKAILSHKTELMALLEAVAVKQTAEPEIRRRPEPREFPLSAGQKGLYIQQQLHPEMTAYNCPLAFRIAGGVQVELMARAWGYALQQFPILTARVIEKDGGLWQRLDCAPELQAQSVDLEDEDELLAFAQARVRAPFDLNQGPLCRIELFTTGGQKSILVITVHHIIYDGVSAMILLDTLFRFYQQLAMRGQVRVAELPGFQSYVTWEEAMLASPEGEAHAAYWQQQLSDELPVLELIADRPRTSAPRFEGRTLVEDLPADLSRWVYELANAQSLTPSGVFLAVFELLLHKVSGQDDILVGMPVNVRPEQKSAPDIGYFVNMVPLRSRCERGLPLMQFLRKSQGTMLDAIYHSAYPFPLMLERLNARHLRKDPVFQVAYAYQNFVAQSAASRLPQSDAARVVNLPIFQELDFDLGLEVFDNPECFNLHLKFNAAVYDETTMRRLLAHFRQLLTAFSLHPDASVDEVSMVTEEEGHTLFSQFSGTAAVYPETACAHHAFVERAIAHPESTALVCGDREISYGELYEVSRDLALVLQARGVGPESIVAVVMDRSAEMMIGIIATVLAGAAYLPLDPAYPDERLAYVLQDSRAALILTDHKNRIRLGSRTAAGAEVISLEDELPRIREQAAALRAGGALLHDGVQAHHLAYVIYTSGSTGQPKGVLVEHRNLVNLVEWHRRAFALDVGSRSTSLAGLGFDAAVWEMWPSLSVGGALVLAGPELQHDPEALLDWWEALPIDVSFLPTPLAELAFSRGMRNERLRVLLTGGDRLRQLPSRQEHFRLINNYGPTECTVVATSGELRATDTLLHIGRPIDGARIYILDPGGQPVPVGIPGEIHIGGAGVARGYMNRPELSAERFLKDPFSGVPGARMYRSGDRGRWLDDGNIEYLGRTDMQVKIRGLRIELAEIEAQLDRHEAIEGCAVIAKGPADNQQLVAFYRARSTNDGSSTESLAEELRAYLLRSLPDYMVPAAFVGLSAIPLNASGKIDRRALAAMEVAMTASELYVAPRTDAERRIVAIWAEVLNRTPESIGVHDDFFRLGGHSLMATQVISRIRRELDVDLPLKAVFDRTTVAGFADLIATARKNGVPSIRPADRSAYDRLPLSFAQERLWFLKQLDPDSAGYNVPGAVTISGALDVDLLDRALNWIIERHESLRTVFPSDDGRPYQRILDRLDLRLDRIDLSALEPAEREAQARRLCQADASAPFDLVNGPLLRGRVIRLAEHEHILMLNMHHIISDGWSLGVLLNELGIIIEALRGGRPPELPPLPIQYADYSVWQRRWLDEGSVLSEQLAYWKEKLAGAPETIDLPADHSRPNVQSFAGATYTFALDGELAGRLERVAEQHGCTLYMVLLAAFNVLLYRYTGQDDLCVGSPIANRQYGETEGLIGMMVNTLTMRNRVERDDTFVSLLSRVRATCLEAYEHQDAPFEKIVDLLRPQRDLAVSPIFQVMLVLQNLDMAIVHPSLRPYPLHSGISKFDLLLELAKAEGGLNASIEYSTALYERTTIERMAGHFVNLCLGLTQTPDAKVGEIDFLSETERRRLLHELNDTGADYPRESCVHQLIADQVAATPDELALISGDVRLTYRQLDARSRELAAYLQALGVKPDSLVAVCLERGAELVVSLLAILRAGGAYVPLDPEYPDERLDSMLRDSAPVVLITETATRDRFPAGVRLLLVGDADTRIAIQDCAGQDRDPVDLGLTPNHLAYVIYTSGSTGQPKGVAMPHRALVNLLTWQRRAGFGPARTLQFAALGFDVAFQEIFSTLSAGGCLLLITEELRRDPAALIAFMREQSVERLFLPMVALQNLAEAAMHVDEPLRALKTVITAGEQLRSDPAITRLFGPGRRLHNHYGPTETHVVTAYELPEDPAVWPALPPIGRPIANTRIYVTDERGNLQPAGVAGELHVGGDAVARGYLNRPELTDEKFVPNPFEPGTRMYKTGDLARWLDDGTLQYLGRSDRQVKIRGFRVELGEIEAQLHVHPAIQEAVVTMQGDGAGKKLIAFYKAKDLAEVPSDELRVFLSKTLPDYMIPSAFVSLAAIPLSPNGKVDRRALGRMDVTVAAGAAYAAPRTQLERDLVTIWAEVLRRTPESIGIHDDFFELGGHSLLATQLISRIRRDLGIEIPLKTLFERPNVALLAAAAAGVKGNEVPVIRPIDRTRSAHFPLSYAQERLWFINELVPGSAGYNLPAAVKLSGPMDVEALEQALNLCIARHESLRTVFPSRDGRGEQVIRDHIDFRLRRFDVSGLDDVARRSEAQAICRAEAASGFDLAAGPLLRALVIKMSDDEHVLMINMHHIISDGWSMGILVRELGEAWGAFRDGRPAELPPLPIQYVDYSVWQRQWLESSGMLEQQLAYWQEKLGGAPETLDLVTDFPRPAVQSFAGATHVRVLDPQLCAQLKRLGEQQGATLYMVLLAAVKVLLYRYTGQRDLCVGSPIANRQYAETHGVAGMFVNTLALRSSIDGDDTFAQFLARVKGTCLDAYEHQDAPFEKVVERLRPGRNLAGSPLFQAMVVLQNVDIGSLSADAQPFPLESGISKFDLTFELTETADGLVLRIEYCTALYRRETIERMAEHLATVCAGVAAAPETAVGDLPVYGDEERRFLLTTCNDTRTEYPKDQCIHELFAARVEAHPDRVAVVHGDDELTYRQLHDRSSLLARYLQFLGVGPDRIVAVCMERSLDMMVGILGTLQAGGAYAPMDAEYPPERLAAMLRDSGARVVLTRSALHARLAAAAGRETRVIALDTEWEEIRHRGESLRRDDVPLQRDVRPTDLAYVIYTSGSTGQPKGVMVEHRSVNRLVLNTNYLEIFPSDVFLQLSSPSFDAATLELWGPLLNGAKLVLPPQGLDAISRLGETIRAHRVTVLWLTSGLFQLLVNEDVRELTSLRVLLTGGDVVPVDHVRRFLEKAANTILINGYGPTENTTFTTCHVVSGPFTGDRKSLPIGRPIANTEVYILDSRLHAQPVGVPGDLYIAGDGLARGYLHAPELTAEKFLRNPFRAGARMYRSGDRARWLPDGTIEFLGRGDAQVKIRGFRMELEEIEGRLNQHPEIRESAVVAHGDEGNKQLVAFYRARGTTGENLVALSGAELRAHVADKLPQYMVPGAFVSVAAIPLSSSGKIDRRALARLDVPSIADEDRAAPRTQVERELAAIWAAVLKRGPETIGVGSNFFELGGHSLDAVQLIARINQRFGRSLSVGVLFSAPTIAAIAALLEGGRAAVTDLPVPIQTQGDASPVFAVPGAGGSVLSLQPLGRALGNEQPLYALQTVGLDGVVPPLPTVEETARVNLAALKGVQPEGPYRFIGHSYGGVVAYEMTRILLEQGEEVASLVLLDSRAPSAMQTYGNGEETADLLEAFTSAARLYDLTLAVDHDLLHQLPPQEQGAHLIALLTGCNPGIDGEQVRAFYEVYRANIRCYRAYRPSPLRRQVDTSLYRATAHSADERLPAADVPPDYGWGELLPGGLRIHDVDADHFSILKIVTFNELAPVTASSAQS